MARLDNDGLRSVRNDANERAFDNFVVVWDGTEGGVDVLAFTMIVSDLCWAVKSLEEDVAGLVVAYLLKVLFCAKSIDAVPDTSVNVKSSVPRLNE